jgi:hypothetical protein
VKALTVDFVLIAQSMRDLSRLTDDYYLDRNTGKVFALSRELIRSLEQDRTEERSNLPDWDTQMIPLAREIVLMGSTRYIRVPESFGYPEHRWMGEFAKDVQSYRLKQKLFQALRGRGACQRFKEILKDSPEEGKRWLEYHQARWEETIQQWLESHGILAVNARPHVRAAR